MVITPKASTSHFAWACVFQMREFDAILSGLILSCDYDAGQKLVSKEEAYLDYAKLFQVIILVQNRVKVGLTRVTLNPYPDLTLNPNPNPGG